MASRDIKAMAFDWGGVFTIGTFDGSAVRNLARHFKVPEEKVALVYFPLMAEFEAGAFDFATFYKRFLERSGLHTSAEAFQTVFLGSVKERPEMVSLLRTIPPHYQVGMLSNNVAVLCDLVRNDPRMQRIDRFVFSNEIAVRKPDPRAFTRLSEALSVAPEHTVFVDDNSDNIEISRKLGYQGILFDSFEGFLVQWRTLLPEAMSSAHGR